MGSSGDAGFARHLYMSESVNSLCSLRFKTLIHATVSHLFQMNSDKQ